MPSAVQSRLALAALIASFCLFAASAWKPLQLDNMDFPAVARQTAATGLPVYYRGEANPHAIGLYHPPLYIYTLALWISLLGFGEAQVRLFGYMCVLLQGWIVLEWPIAFRRCDSKADHGMVLAAVSAEPIHATDRLDRGHRLDNLWPPAMRHAARPRPHELARRSMAQRPGHANRIRDTRRDAAAGALGQAYDSLASSARGSFVTREAAGMGQGVSGYGRRHVVGGGDFPRHLLRLRRHYRVGCPLYVRLYPPESAPERIEREAGNPGAAGRF